MTNEEVNQLFRTGAENINAALTEAVKNGMKIDFNVVRGENVECKAKEVNQLVVVKVSATTIYEAKEGK